FRGPSFHFQHLMEFQRLKSRMRQVEWNGNGRYALGREPLVPKVAVGAQQDSTCGQLAIKLADRRLQLAIFDPYTEIADAEREQFLVFERVPRRLYSHLHGYILPCRMFLSCRKGPQAVQIQR